MSMGILDLSGLVVKSNGKYEGTHWNHVLLKKKEDGYLSWDHNNFNVGSLTFEELETGYLFVPPLTVFKSLKEFAEDLKDAQDRWGDM